MAIHAPKKCSSCGFVYWPGRIGLHKAVWEGADHYNCPCGARIEIRANHDSWITSPATVVRLAAISNVRIEQTLKVEPGSAVAITFDPPLQAVGLLRVETKAKGITVGHTEPTGVGVTVLTSFARDSADSISTPVDVVCEAFGLVDMDAIPPWWLQFYSAASNGARGMWKPSLLDYAASFELFLEAHLHRILTSRYEEKLSMYLLSESWGVERRATKILHLATGRSLANSGEIYQNWKQYVQGPRNRLAHGEMIAVDERAAYDAHLAVFRAIRWIQHEATVT